MLIELIIKDLNLSCLTAVNAGATFVMSLEFGLKRKHSYIWIHQMNSKGLSSTETKNWWEVQPDTEFNRCQCLNSMFLT